jgi:16S rRNA (cytosine1402-N4)-methyltransferase
LIVEARNKKQINSAAELTEIIKSGVRKRGKINPATKTFQALRIAVNNELGVIEEALPKAIAALKGGGRVAAISFHSKEDRIVKFIFKKLESDEKIKILTKKPVTAEYGEVRSNPRSRSAKLRVAEKI